MPQIAKDHPLKEIALQAGVSLATVDRVVHGRGGVRKSTLRRVHQAVAELGRQSEQAVLRGRKFMIDVAMEAPERFTRLVRQALERELPGLHPADFRARFHLAETITPRDMAALLKRIARRGSNGVILKAPDTPEIRAAVESLAEARVPVVTLVTDIANARRFAYVGIDNRAAGETAAYLVGQWLGQAPAKVLVTLSSSRFRGEEEREIGFRRALRERYPALSVVEVSEGFGRDRQTGALAGAALAANPDIRAVYSAGGGNRAIVAAFAAAERECRVFIGHDLDTDNRRLLKAGAIGAVLHHDLGQDMRQACQLIMQANGALKRQAASKLSQFQVITPFNLPY
jgi:LacI family transcriptional regulator